MEISQIIMSSRLKNSPVAQFLSELGIYVRYVTLRRGDFVLANKYGVRYFSGDEFIRGIEDRSVYREILELKRAYTDPVIIVEGMDAIKDSNLSLATYQGAVLFASVLNRVPVLTTANDVETAQMIFITAAQTGKSIDWQMAMADTAEAEVVSGSAGHGDPRISIISRLPDVGISLAKGLLKHFGSLSRLFAAKITDLKKVQGIGPKRAEKIFVFLNGNKAA